MNDTMHVKGLSDLAKALATLPMRIEKNIMRGALRAGLAPVSDHAKTNAAKATGALARGLKVSTDSRKGKVYAKLRTTGKHDYIARFVEFGTARHRIAGKNGGMLRIAGKAFARSVDHPGARAIPFMRPALDAKADAAVQETAAYISKRLTAEGIKVPDVGDEK